MRGIVCHSASDYIDKASDLVQLGRTYKWLKSKFPTSI